MSQSLTFNIYVETQGGLADPLIMLGTRLPARRKRMYTTALDDQSEVEVHILAGYKGLARENRSLHRFRMTGIPPMPARVPQVELSLSIDENLALTMAAKLVGSKSSKELAKETIQIDLSMVQGVEHRKSDTVSMNEVRLMQACARLQSEVTRAKQGPEPKGSAGWQQIESLLGRAELALKSPDLTEIEGLTEELVAAQYVPYRGDFASIFHSIFSGPSVQSDEVEKSHKVLGASGSTLEGPVAVHDGANADDKSAMKETIFGGGVFSEDPTMCFVLMPFSEAFRMIYDDHIVPVTLQAGLHARRADDEAAPNVITRDIWELINRSRILLADLTGQNANVFYELGLAHALGKTVLLLTQKIEDVPFDLRRIRCIQYEYSPRGMRQFESRLEAAIKAALARI